LEKCHEKLINSVAVPLRRQRLWLVCRITCSLGGRLGLKTLPDHIPSAVAHLSAIGTLPDTNRLNLSIGLPLRTRRDWMISGADCRPGQSQLPALFDAGGVHGKIRADGIGLPDGH